MGKIVQFPFGEEGKGKEEKENRIETLDNKDIERLYEPFKEGLKKLYPSQVKDVLGIVGFGEKNGNEVMLMGILIWEHYKQPRPIASTFIALFVNDRLEKVSFLEAKNNYWDWKLMIDMYQHRFNTKKMFEDLKRLREEFLNR